MAANAMETDDLGHLPSSTLRRSNSAPNVSAAVVSEAIPIFQPLQTARQRRFSTSQMAVNIGSPASRIAQIKREELESMDEASRERQIESELSLTIGMHDHMTLMDHDKNHDADMHERRNSFDDHRHPFPSPSSLSSSPTNNQKAMKGRSLTPSPIPSPTRTTFMRRSLSPVYFKPSTLTLKRKWPSEGFEPGVSPSKRVCDVSPLNCSPNGPVESEHINFDEENNIHEDPGSSSASDTSTSSSSATPMLFGEIPRQPLPLYRSKFTPPRSPLAGPSTTQSLPRTLGNSPSCFTFSPVQD